MFALECAVYVGGIRLDSLSYGPHFCDAFAFESQQKEAHGTWIPRSLDDVDMPKDKIAVAQEVFDLDPPFRGHPVGLRNRLQKRIPSGSEPPIVMDSTGSEQACCRLRQRAVSSSLHKLGG
jgi:hypothetical protein